MTTRVLEFPVSAPSRPTSDDRKQAARRWLDAWADDKRMQPPLASPASKALAVIALTHATSDYLSENDPMALKQCQLALSGTCWENFLG